MSASLIPNSSQANEIYHRFRIAGMPLSAIAFLVLTAVITLLWSHYQLLWTDEFYPLETDSVASIARLVHIQITAPISLDPLTYNAFAHVAIRLFGAGAFAI